MVVAFVALTRFSCQIVATETMDNVRSGSLCRGCVCGVGAILEPGFRNGNGGKHKLWSGLRSLRVRRWRSDIARFSHWKEWQTVCSGALCGSCVCGVGAIDVLVVWLRNGGKRKLWNALWSVCLWRWRHCCARLSHWKQWKT